MVGTSKERTGQRLAGIGMGYAVTRYAPPRKRIQNMRDEEQNLDAAQIGKMFVTSVSFTWREAQAGKYDDKTGKYAVIPGHWQISATLRDKPSQYGEAQQMGVQVEHGIGQKLAEVLLPVVIADASRKAEQLANDSKAMLQALGDRTLACIADMPDTKE